MRRYSQSARLLGALAIALLLVTTFAVQLHEAVVPHAICPEHGESIELASGVPQGEVDPASLHELRLVGGDGGGETHHEHCDIALLGRTKELLDTRFVPTPFASGERWEPVRNCAARARPSVPLLLQAPKHSPPALA